MNILKKAYKNAKKNKGKVIFPESGNEKILKAIEYLHKENLADIVFCEDEKISSLHENVLIKNRPKIKRKLASKILQKPIYLAGSMLALNKADVMIAGIETPTKNIIESAGLTLGYKEKNNFSSSVFLMIFDDGKEVIFSDCALNVNIDINILVNIAKNASKIAKSLYGKSMVSLLSYSTLSSGKGPSVDLVSEATKILKNLNYNVVGPIQVDAALSKAVSKAKQINNWEESNVFIFPSLDSGNIAYKLCQQLANAKAIGPFLEGFKKPVCDLSRGATTEDIINATLLSFLMKNL